MKPTKPTPSDRGTQSRPRRILTPGEIKDLEAAGCMAENWGDVLIHPATDLRLIRDVEFEGSVYIGLLLRRDYPGSGIRNARIRDSIIGNGVRISYVPEGIVNAEIGEGAIIENCGGIIYSDNPEFGIGLSVGVLDETGGREVVILPGLTSQTASLTARSAPQIASRLRELARKHIAESGEMPKIGQGVVIRGCGLLKDVSVGHDVEVIGARVLRNGSIINNSPAGKKGLAHIGDGVDAEGFIVEDGAVESGSIIRHCYIGQGVRLEKGFNAHDSLFFANSTLENGEACALLGGPYTVSMHKGSLLIACQTSFMNAGSTTNLSNHMYKLGPIHWGVLERGVKTASGSYLMLGADIGAFSMLMGSHKMHPDSSEFPFSYLFSDAQNATVVVPAVMLRSCGLMRDEAKWPERDRRKGAGLPLNDNVAYGIFSPVTVAAMAKAIKTIGALLERPADDDRYIRHKGMKLSRASLERALKLYYLGIMKYLQRLEDEQAGKSMEEASISEDLRKEASGEWIDLGGQPIPRMTASRATSARSYREMRSILDEAYAAYGTMQQIWAERNLLPEFSLTAERVQQGAEEFDRLVEQDRHKYLRSLEDEQRGLELDL